MAAPGVRRRLRPIRTGREGAAAAEHCGGGTAAVLSPRRRGEQYLPGRMSLFPDTRHSVVAALASTDAAVRSRATELVAGAYRAPVVAVLRHRWSLEQADAEDLAHDFFAHALARDWLQRYDPAKGRFRTFLRSCLLAFGSTAHEAAARLKRGGGAVHVAFDDAVSQGGDGLGSEAAIDALFEREWVRSVLQLSLAALRAECEGAGRGITWHVFVAHDVEGAELEASPSYAQLAERFGIPRTQVTNYLNWARRRLRVHVIETLRSLTASDEEFRDEARALLGVETP